MKKNVLALIFLCLGLSVLSACDKAKEAAPTKGVSIGQGVGDAEAAEVDEGVELQEIIELEESADPDPAHGADMADEQELQVVDELKKATKEAAEGKRMNPDPSDSDFSDMPSDEELLDKMME